MPNYNPLIPVSARTERIRITNTTAKTSNPTNKLFTAGTNGSRIEKLEVINAYSSGAAAAASRIVRFYILVDGFYALYKETFIPTTGGTPTFPADTYQVPGGLCLGPNQEIWVSQSVYTGDKDATTIIIHAKDF